MSVDAEQYSKSRKTLGGRLKIAIEAAGLTVSQFDERMLARFPTWRLYDSQRIINGWGPKPHVPAGSCQYAADLLGVSIEWLRDGKPSPTSGIEAVLAKSDIPLEQSRKLIQLFERLPLHCEEKCSRA